MRGIYKEEYTLDPSGPFSEDRNYGQTERISAEQVIVIRLPVQGSAMAKMAQESSVISLC
jgi:hypothetical protein